MYKVQHARTKTRHRVRGLLMRLRNARHVLRIRIRCLSKSHLRRQSKQHVQTAHYHPIQTSSTPKSACIWLCQKICACQQQLMNLPMFCAFLPSFYSLSSLFVFSDCFFLITPSMVNRSQTSSLTRTRALSNGMPSSSRRSRHMLASIISVTRRLMRVS